jgi:WD40 repeat protein
MMEEIFFYGKNHKILQVLLKKKTKNHGLFSKSSKDTQKTSMTFNGQKMEHTSSLHPLTTPLSCGICLEKSNNSQNTPTMFEFILISHHFQVQGVCFDPLSMFFVSQSGDKSCRIFSMKTQKCTDTIKDKFKDENVSS